MHLAQSGAVALSAWLLLSLLPALADEIPAAPPQDAVMAPPAEVQAMHDWAHAAFLGTGATKLLWAARPPFSFRYAGRDSGQSLPGWKRSTETKREPNCTRHTVTWTDPATAIAVRAAARLWDGYPAVEWVLSFRNAGAADTPVLEDIQALDLSIASQTAGALVLHQILGDSCNERSFLPQATPLAAGQSVAFAPNGGRSSNGVFPFFNLQYADQGLIAAVGWSGQWAAAVERSKQGPSRLRAGMEKTHLVLHAGEEIRSPRILLLAWRGDRLAAHNRFRRLMLHHYVPRLEGRPLRLPTAMQCFDRYFRKRPEWSTEAGQLAAIEMTRRVGCDAHWFDAAWFDRGFPTGVGNWYPDPRSFPRGLRPLGDACDRAGLKLILWYEPERVADDTQIAREHPEFVFPGGKSRLFRLDSPVARRWLTELLSRQIREFGLDVYRNDFNIDPLPSWRAADAPDRQGITEIRYVEGLYAMWDELRARHPGLWIDNCASGGRRIDLETCSRSVPLWRSDTSCRPGNAEWDQTQTLGLSLYVPLFTACGWSTEAYVLRSSATAGAICQFDYLNDAFPLEQARQAIAEVRQNQPFWYGDFYPLTEGSVARDVWAAFQFHRPDLNAGIVLAFRRPQCPYPTFEARFAGLDPAASYSVEYLDEARQSRQAKLSGRQLSEPQELRLAQGTSLLIRYRKTGP